jgi:hypothetical protein
MINEDKYRDVFNTATDRARTWWKDNEDGRVIRITKTEWPQHYFVEVPGSKLPGLQYLSEGDLLAHFLPIPARPMILHAGERLKSPPEVRLPKKDDRYWGGIEVGVLVSKTDHTDTSGPFGGREWIVEDDPTEQTTEPRSFNENAANALVALLRPRYGPGDIPAEPNTEAPTEGWRWGQRDDGVWCFVSPVNWVVIVDGERLTFPSFRATILLAFTLMPKIVQRAGVSVRRGIQAAARRVRRSDEGSEGRPMTEEINMSIEQVEAELKAAGIEIPACAGKLLKMAATAYAARDDLKRQLAEAQAAVGGLPKTKDGVSMVPGMIVWVLWGHKPIPQKLSVAFVSSTGASLTLAGADCGGYAGRDCYTTREAALAGLDSMREAERKAKE